MDDHPIVRQGLRTLLESEPGWEVIGEASDGRSAVEMITQQQPDVAVVDVILPDLNGLEVIQQVVERVSLTRVIMLSMHAHESYVAQALQCGASAYVLKATSTANLVTAIREALVGRRYLSPPLTQQSIDDYIQRVSQANQPVDRYLLLTRREREVLHLIVEGHTNNQIAKRLSISPRTVETHRANLMRKLQLQTSSELHHYAHRRGLVGNSTVGSS